MTEASPASYSRHRPCRASDVARWDLQTDVVIVGFGAAGASAAIEAANAGAQVTLFEATSGHGGTSALSGGEIYMGGTGGTPLPRDAGFHGERDDFSQYLGMACGRDAAAAKRRVHSETSPTPNAKAP